MRTSRKALADGGRIAASLGRRPRGFTLIEVVVAFALLALVLSTGFRIFSEGMSRASLLEERSQALAVLRSHLDGAGNEEKLQPGSSTGEAHDPRFRWTTVIEPLPIAREEAQPANIRFELLRVAVRVDWRGSDGRDHMLEMATVKLGDRQ